MATKRKPLGEKPEIHLSFCDGKCGGASTEDCAAAYLAGIGIRCGDCAQMFADKGNIMRCKCPCHSPLPTVDGRPEPMYRYPFRYAR